MSESFKHVIDPAYVAQSGRTMARMGIAREGERSTVWIYDYQVPHILASIDAIREFGAKHPAAPLPKKETAAEKKAREAREAEERNRIAMQKAIADGVAATLAAMGITPPSAPTGNGTNRIASLAK